MAKRSIAKLRARISKLNKQAFEAHQRWREAEHEKAKLVRELEALEREASP